MFSWKTYQMAACLLLATTGVVSADVIVTPTITSNSGVYTYNYSINNTGSDGIFSFGLSIFGPVFSSSGPSSAGWLIGTSAPVAGTVLVSWESTDVSFDVQSNGSLSGFKITSPNSPGPVQFSVLDESLNEFDGQTTGPVAPVSSVPEPNTGSLTALGAGVSAALFKRKSGVAK